MGIEQESSDVLNPMSYGYSTLFFILYSPTFHSMKFILWADQVLVSMLRENLSSVLGYERKLADVPDNFPSLIYW
jgi:hypothetical protein